MLVRLSKAFSFLILNATSFLYGKIGKLSYIMGNKYIINPKALYIGSYVRILYGFRCEIYTKKGLVDICNRVSIGHNCHISSCERLVIGENTVISSNVFIGSLDHDLSDLIIEGKINNIKCSPTIIGRNCFIGTGAVILPGTVIGDYSTIGAMTIVRGKYPDRSVIIDKRKYVKKPI